MFIVPGLMFLITTLVVAQMEPLACSTSTNDCTMTFSVSKPAQTGPTTTLYDSIMTSSLNIINCRYCAVTNVENNAPDVGPFTTKVTSDVLVVTRAGCMTETTAVTRRDFRGYDEEDGILSPRTIGASIPKDLHELRQLHKREPEDLAPEVLDSYLPSRLIQSEQDLAHDFTENIDRGNWTVIQAIQTYRRQCYSALLAIGWAVTGQSDLFCNLSRTADVQISLAQEGFDGKQVENLICFWAVFGYRFDTSVYAVMDTLATAATSFTFALQYGLNSTQDVKRLCDGLNLNDPMYDMLHIDSRGISNVLCSGSSGVDTATSTSANISWSTQWASGSAVTSFVGSSWSFITGVSSINGSGSGFTWTSTGTGGAFTTTGNWSIGGNETSFVNGTGVPAGTAATGTWGASWSAGGGTTSGAVGSGVSTGAAGNTVTQTQMPAATATGSGIASSVITAAPPAFTSWSTFTNGNGSMIISGVASATGGGSFWTLTGFNGSVTVVPISWTTYTYANGSVAVSGIASATGSGNGGFGTVIVAGGSAGSPAPASMSWSTFTNVNESIIISGVATATVVGGGGGVMTSNAGSQPTPIGAPAWTSWTTYTNVNGSVVVSGVAAATGTAAPQTWSTSTFANGSIIVSGQASNAAGGAVISWTTYTNAAGSIVISGIAPATATVDASLTTVTNAVGSAVVSTIISSFVGDDEASLTTLTSSNGSVIVSTVAGSGIAAGQGSWTTYTDASGSIIVSSIAGSAEDGASGTWTTYTDASGSVVVSSIAGSGAGGGAVSWVTVTNVGGTIIVSGVPGQATGAAGSLTTFTDAAGSVIVSTVAASGGAGDAGGAGGAESGGMVYSYSGMAWTSWIVSSTPTVDIITGTADSIDYGNATATALVTGSGQAATFTVVLVTKTIIIYATAIGQTWSASETVAGSGTSGTWTMETTAYAGTGIGGSNGTNLTISGSSWSSGTTYSLTAESSAAAPSWSFSTSTWGGPVTLTSWTVSSFAVEVTTASDI